MDIERKFEDLGIDAVTGVKLMGIMGLSQYDFAEPVRFMRFKDVIDYFKDVPDSNFIINKITIGKNVDKLDHVWGYVELSRQKDEYRKESAHIEKDLRDVSTFAPDNTFIKSDLIKRINTVSDKLVSLDDQLDQYAN